MSGVGFQHQMVSRSKRDFDHVHRQARGQQQVFSETPVIDSLAILHILRQYLAGLLPRLAPRRDLNRVRELAVGAAVNFVATTT
jgi:hypothetical protein